MDGRDVPTRWRSVLPERKLDVTVSALNTNAVRPVTSLGSCGAQERRFWFEQGGDVWLWLSEWCPKSIAKLAVQFGRSNLHEHVSTVERPSHLLFLDHPLADE